MFQDSLILRKENMGFGVKTKVKKCVKWIDTRLLNNRIAEKYANLKLMHGEELYNFRSKLHRRFNRKGKIRVLMKKELSVRDLFLSQYYNGDYLNYVHCDGAVRMMALEEYYHKNQIGFDLYRRVQAVSGFDWTERYQKLIASYEKEGYRKGNPIELDAHLQILDGSHRLTLALYSGQEFIDAAIYNNDRRRVFDYDWFWKNGFSAKECHMVQDCVHEILQNAKYEYVGVLWPPAVALFDEIIENLRQYDPERVQVRKTMDMTLERGDFIQLFKALYHTDILNESGMNHKISLIENCMSDHTVYPIRVFYLWVEEPQMGINPKNYTTQSRMVKALKTVFRARYQKRIANYQYDVIMHITDNYLQSKFCRILLELDRNVEKFFRKMGQFDYSTIKLEEGKQSEQFPQNYYFSKDVDILVKQEDILKVAAVVKEYLEEKYALDWLTVENISKKGSEEFWVRLRDYNVFNIHIQSTEYFGMKEGYSVVCLSKRRFDQKGYYYLSPEVEVIFRSVELVRKPSKKWHEAYIKKNIAMLQDDLLNEAFPENADMKAQIRNMWDGLRRQHNDKKDTAKI